MRKGTDLIEKFEKLGPIEPSAGWDEKLFVKISRVKNKSEDSSGTRLIFLAIFILVVFNLFSITKNWKVERLHQDSTNLKYIASEYLITTNSSKF